MAVAKPDKVRRFFRTVTQEAIDAILKDIDEGATRKHAAEANGISRRHFHMLVAQGVIDLECGLETLQSNMVKTLRRIEMREIKTCRQLIRKSGKGHRGAEWTLEHTYWRDFGSNSDSIILSREIEDLRLEMAAKDKEKKDDIR